MNHTGGSSMEVGKPTPVLRPFNAKEKRRWENAKARRKLRAEMEQRLKAVRQPV